MVPFSSAKAALSPLCRSWYSARFLRHLPLKVRSGKQMIAPSGERLLLEACVPSQVNCSQVKSSQLEACVPRWLQLT